MKCSPACPHSAFSSPSSRTARHPVIAAPQLDVALKAAREKLRVVEEDRKDLKEDLEEGAWGSLDLTEGLEEGRGKLSAISYSRVR